MIAYASRTGTRINLDALRSAGWRLLVSATGVWRTEGFPYAIDNGAWTAFQSGRPFDEDAFLNLLLVLGPEADFVVVPDIVRGGHESLRFSLRWLPRLWWLSVPKLIAVQDGVTPADLAGVLGPQVGVFIGGTDGWKEATMALWAEAAHQAGAICHVGRVNSQRRIRLCQAAGVDSIDGSSASRYMLTLGPLQRALLTGAAQLQLNAPAQPPESERS